MRTVPQEKYYSLIPNIYQSPLKCFRNIRRVSNQVCITYCTVRKLVNSTSHCVTPSATLKSVTMLGHYHMAVNSKQLYMLHAYVEGYRFGYRMGWRINTK